MEDRCEIEELQIDVEAIGGGRGAEARLTCMAAVDHRLKEETGKDGKTAKGSAGFSLSRLCGGAGGRLC